MNAKKLATQIKRNGSVGPMNHTDIAVNISNVVELMIYKTGSPLTKRAAAMLLNRMADSEWTLLEGIHTSQSDSSPHILILVDNVRYHLRVSRKGLIFEITCPGNNPAARRALTDGRAPYMSPQHIVN